MLRAVLPDVTTWWSGHIVHSEKINRHSIVGALSIVGSATTRIVGWSISRRVSIDHACRRPRPAILTTLGADVEIVHQDKSLSDRVLVRRDFAREHNDALIAVALREVGENVVIGSVLFHDVDHVLDPWILEIWMVCRAQVRTQEVVLCDLS